jgi:hypothetical protein
MEALYGIRTTLREPPATDTHTKPWRTHLVEAKDLRGLRVGRLTVQHRVARIGSNGAWLCLCDCGNHKVLPTYLLTARARASCGCRPKPHRGGPKPHAEKDTSLYRLWINVKRRSRAHVERMGQRYGAQRAALQEEWRTFDSFKSWAIVNGYEEGVVLRRKYLAKAYTPENCYLERVTVGGGIRKKVPKIPRVRPALEGQRFGRLNVKMLFAENHNGRRWLCECDCGREMSFAEARLTAGRRKSCGCGSRSPNRLWKK